MRTRSGFRYHIEFPMGFQTAAFTSKTLYPSRGHAIDAMREAYPENEYDGAKRGILDDEEVEICDTCKADLAEDGACKCRHWIDHLSKQKQQGARNHV